MWGVRRQISLLMAEGHPDARHYPIGMVWDEASLVVSRINRAHATDALLIQLAVGAVLSKKGAQEFSKQIKRLNGSGD